MQTDDQCWFSTWQSDNSKTIEFIINQHCTMHKPWALISGEQSHYFFGLVQACFLSSHTTRRSSRAGIALWLVSISLAFLCLVSHRSVLAFAWNSRLTAAGRAAGAVLPGLLRFSPYYLKITYLVVDLLVSHSQEQRSYPFPCSLCHWMESAE